MSPEREENRQQAAQSSKKSMTQAAIEEQKERERAVLMAARRLARGKPATGWTHFYEQVFGPRGIVSRHYPSAEDRGAFERRPVYQKLQRMLAKLRQKDPSEVAEPTRVITVRLPSKIHLALRSEAHLLNTSINQLCIAKLMQIIDKDLVSTDERQGRRKREEPGPKNPPPLE